MKNSEVTISENKLHRSLQTRHLNMIAIGGAIGTGLFFASGSAISTSGPGGAVLAYAIMGLLVYLIMTSLGEMATLLPISGSFETYATRFVNSSLGFTLGWNYWFSWSITVATELVAASLIMKFWFPGSSATLWSILFLLVLFILNVLSTRAYGEAEYWFAGIKVVAVIVFIIIGTLLIFGILGGKSPGFSNWTLDAGQNGKAPFIGGIAAMIQIFLVAGFSFQGTEIVGIAAGESNDPQKSVPKAINAVFWRVLIFYIGAIIIIGFLIPFTNENLLKSGAENIAYSPFTLILKNSGIAFAASLMNFVILTSVLSAGNSGFYVSTRMLYAMSLEGRAPRIFSKLNKRGVPLNALLVTCLVASLSFFASLVGDGRVYTILYNITGLTGFVVWLGIAICHYRFRKAYLAQGKRLEDLKYIAKWYPFGPILAIILCAVVIFGANVWVFQTPKLNWFDFITNYGLIPALLIMYYCHKAIKKTKTVRLEEASFSIDSRRAK